jgi:2-polyprenyl-3-methyl-5-hydroxy-6-metoxy-1,4-benzoquinol methylase
MTGVTNDLQRQQQHFDRQPNQYRPATVVSPPTHSAIELERVIKVLSSIPPTATVVDFGAGTGRLAIAVARAGYRVIAVDISRASLDVLERIAADLGLENIQTTTRLPDCRVDAVVGADALHHVDLHEWLPRLRALLTSAGKAVFSEPGGFNPAWYPYLAALGQLRVEKRIVNSNIATLRRGFSRHGFRDVIITGIGLAPRPLLGFRESVCRRHDYLGNVVGLRWFAYRYLVEAVADH